MFKLSFSSNAFTNYTAEETISYISYLGYEGIEILGDVPHINNKSEISNLKSKIEMSGLTVSNINTNDCKEFENVFGEEPFFTSRKEVFELKLKQFIRNIEIARQFNCTNISISSGPVTRDKKKNEVLDTFFHNLNVALSHLPYEINLGIELEPTHLIQNLRDYEEIFSNFKNKNLGINLDIGHLYCAGDTIENAFDKYGNKIFHIHLEDIRDYKHYHLVLGDGNLPLKDIIKFLEKNYDGYVSIELYTYKNNPVMACFASKLYLLFNNSLPNTNLSKPFLKNYATKSY